MSITITPEALVKIKSLSEKEDASNRTLRVGVKGGGCSGFSYDMKFVGGPKDKDIVMNFDDMVVVCDPKSIEFLKDMEIWFDRNLIGGGLKFRNPNAKKSCSCGESFSV